MANIYGGKLVIENGYTSVLNDFSSRMNKAGDSLNDFSKKSKKGAEDSKRAWQSSMEGMNQSLDKFSDSAFSTITKITAGWLGLKGVMSGIKNMFSSGVEYENSAMFMKSAFGDKLGTEKYKWATKEAEKTPFGQIEVTNALARAKMLGLAYDPTSFRRYEDLGSMAKITGTGDLSSAIDAISDMMNGEWERIQTILGVKRTGLEDYAKENGMKSFSNKKGQVTDQKALMDVFNSYIDEKGISGMTEKFGQTMSGRFDTLKDTISATLAEIGGMQADGTLKKGGLFDEAMSGIEKFIKAIEKFGKSESFDILKSRLEQLGNGLLKFIDYLSDNPSTVSNLLKLGGAIIGLKVVTSILNPISKLISTLGLFRGEVELFSRTMNKTNAKNMVSSGTGALSKVGKIGAMVALPIVASKSLMDNDGLIHKFFNVANPVNWFKQKGDKDDVTADIFGYASKIDTWIANKTGLLNDTEANLAYQGADKYMKDSKEYINGRISTAPSLADVGQNVVVNIDKVQNDNDAEGLIMKIVNALNKNKARNSTSYN